MVNRLSPIAPGPVDRGAGNKLPDPLPAGALPDENSRMWFFTPKAVQEGEAFIKDDTRAWFDDRDRKVVICREYVDHPRWMIAGAESIRAKLYNGHIVAEIHMLARIHAGLPDVPEWVPARMTVKQQQADVGFRLTKITRDVFRKQGKEAMELFADKQPGQFIKFIAATFIPKQIETTLNSNPNEMPKEQIGQIIDALEEELNRRAEEAKLVSEQPMDYEAPAGITAALEGAAEVIIDAAGTNHPGVARMDGHPEAARNLRHVIDLAASEVTENDGWDDPPQGDDDGW